MNKNEKQNILVENILEKVGGFQNIKDVYHCATRMRFTLVDESLALVDEIKTISTIKGALWSNGELQLIVGPEVSVVTGLLKQKLSQSNVDNNVEFEVGKQKHSSDKGVPMWRRFLKSVSAIFGPLIPFLIGVGLLMAVQQLFIRTGLGSDVNAKDAVLGKDYNVFDYVLNILAGTGFKMMGVIAMWSTVRYLGGKTPIAIALALMMVSPIIPEAGIHLINIGSWEILLKPFYSTILVFIVMGIIIAIGQKQMDKHFNPVANFILNPFLTLLIGGILAFFLFGPIMGILEKVMLDVFNWFMTLPFGIGTLIVGLTWQPLVVLGVHNILFFAATTELINTQDPSLFLAAAFAAAWGQMGATIGVAIRSKKSVDKSSAIAAAIPGIISGPTESCIYAVNLPKWTPFITGVIAGGIGGWMIGVFNVGLNNLAGLGGIVGFLAYTDKLGLAIFIDLFAFALGILITMLVWREEKTEKMLVLDTTKLFKKNEFLDNKNDFKAQELINLIKLTKKTKYSVEIKNEFQQLSNEIAQIDLDVSKEIVELIKKLDDSIIDKNFDNNLLLKAKTIVTSRQSDINVVYAELKSYIKSLKIVEVESKKFNKLIIKKENLKFKLEHILTNQEDKSASLFSKGQRLINSEKEKQISKGNELIKLSENLLYKEKQIIEIKNKITDLESQINESKTGLEEVTKIFYDKVVEYVEKIELLKNKDLQYIKDKYFNDIHKLEIREKILTAKKEILI